MNVIQLFEERDRRESERFEALHFKHLGLDELSRKLGTADEWLGAALGHVKVAQDGPGSAGTVTISAAALSLLVWKLEEVLYDGTPWQPGIKYD